MSDLGVSGFRFQVSGFGLGLQVSSFQFQEKGPVRDLKPET
jgi:hypothetical protein